MYFIEEENLHRYQPERRNKTENEKTVLVIAIAASEWILKYSPAQ